MKESGDLIGTQILSIDLFGLLRSRCVCFRELLPVASDHDHCQERSDNRGGKEGEDDRYSDGPNSWREESL